LAHWRLPRWWRPSTRGWSTTPADRVPSGAYTLNKDYQKSAIIAQATEITDKTTKQASVRSVLYDKSHAGAADSTKTAYQAIQPTSKAHSPNGGGDVVRVYDREA
jgi:hypothetical protein